MGSNRGKKPKNHPVLSKKPPVLSMILGVLPPKGKKRKVQQLDFIFCRRVLISRKRLVANRSVASAFTSEQQRRSVTFFGRGDAAE